MPNFAETLTEAEQKKVYEPEQDWSDSFALKITKADFETAENYRTRNHDPRWATSDRLFLGWEEQRYWEGTKIPRSSLGMFVVFSQIQSLLPKVLSSLFADYPWFEVGPEPGTSLVDAVKVRDLIMYQMERMRRITHQSIRQVLLLALTDAFLYGVGPIELAWMEETRKMKRFQRSRITPTRTFEHPQFGEIPLPNGPQQEELVERTIEERRQQPFIRHISAKDIYVDPNHDEPQFQGSRYICTRGYMAVDELWAKRDEPGFSIPTREKLIQLAQDKPMAQADISKQQTEAARGGTWQPHVDSSADPGSLKLEVVTRWSQDRTVWLANREELLYNAHNSYGFIPVFNCFYVPVPGRCYGLSVADVTEAEHRMQGATINARIDEMALHIHGRMVKKRGQPIPSHQLRRRPGQIIEAEHPREDVVLEQISPMMQQAFIEVAASENRVQKITGITDLAVTGVPGAQGNSANRTATGVGVQAQAAFSRLTFLVENIEDTVIEPLLSAWHYMNTQFLPRYEMLKITMGREAETTNQQMDPIDILNADVLFYMRASSKMQSRMALLQAFPLVAQTFLNPDLLAQMHKMGKTFDMSELFTMVLDMTGYKARGKFIRNLTPEEQQSIQQASQQEQNVELVKQRERMESMKELQEMKSAGELQKSIVERGLDAALGPEEPSKTGVGA